MDHAPFLAHEAMSLLHMSRDFLVERVPGSALICRQREFTGVEQVTGHHLHDRLGRIFFTIWDYCLDLRFDIF